MLFKRCEETPGTSESVGIEIAYLDLSDIFRNDVNVKFEI